MTRRMGAGGQAAKPGRRRAVTRKRRNGRKTARGPSVAELQEQLDRRTRELDEALEQQTATSEVLGIISSSPGDLASVFDAMLVNATRICGANFGTLTLREGDDFRNVARYNLPPAFADALPTKGFHPHPKSGLAEVVRTKRMVHIEDLRANQAFLEGDPVAVSFADLTGARTLLIVPMLKEGRLIGTIAIFRKEISRFSDKQIELMSNFAAQAVIAIENTRLLKELRQRTDDLSESLEQQTATSEVLRVISRSPGELDTVFQAMLTNATRICEAKFGVLHRYRDGAFHPAAMVGVPPILAQALLDRGAYVPPPGIALDRLLKTKGTVHILDQAQEKIQPPSAKLGGARSHLSVPLIKDGEIIGAFTIYRTEVRPFTDKQIALLQSFAAQAVIAIENTRLLNELRESLQQQTATADVLRIISSSPGELAPVFNTMIENATRRCGAEVGTLALYDGSGFRGAAVYGHSERYADVVSASTARRRKPGSAGWKRHGRPFKWLTRGPTWHTRRSAA